MQMTESEIKANVLQAADQRAQVRICAELNDVPVGRIQEILKEQGVDLRKLKGNQNPKKPDMGYACGGRIKKGMIYNGYYHTYRQGWHTL